MASVPTVPNTDRILDSTPGSLTTDFTITWPVVGATATECGADLGVYVAGVGVLNPSTDYSFIGNAVAGVNGIYNGGTVRLTTGVNGVRVVIWSQRAPRRTGSFLEGAPLPFSTLDTLMDDFAIQLRDNQLLSRAAVRVPSYDMADDFDGELPDTSARASKALGFDAEGAPAVSASTLAEIDAVVIAAEAGSQTVLFSDAFGGPSFSAILKMRQQFALDDYVGNDSDNADPSYDWSTALATAVLDLPRGGEVQLLRHAYKCNAQVAVNKNGIKIRGQGRGHSQTYGTELYSTLGNHPLLALGADANGYYDFTLEDLTLSNQVGINPTSSALLVLNRANDCSVRGVRVANYYEAVDIQGGNGVTLQDVVTRRGLGDFTFRYSEDTYNGTNVKLMGCRAFPMDGLATTVAFTTSAQPIAGTFTIPAQAGLIGLDIILGQPCQVFANPTASGIRAWGTVTAYNSATGAMTCTLTSNAGDTSTTKTSWTLQFPYRASHTGLLMSGGSTLAAVASQFNRCDRGIKTKISSLSTIPSFIYLESCEAEHSNTAIELQDFNRVHISSGHYSLSVGPGMIIGKSDASGTCGDVTLDAPVNVILGQQQGIIHYQGRLEANGKVWGNGLKSTYTNPSTHTYSGIEAHAGNLHVRSATVGGRGSYDPDGAQGSQQYGIDLSNVVSTQEINIVNNDLTQNNVAGVYDPNALASAFIQGNAGYVDGGTATIATLAATCNHRKSVITSDSRSDAASARFAFTISNNKINANSVVNAMVKNGTNTTTGICVESVNCSTGQVIVGLRNSNASSALNGTIILTLTIMDYDGVTAT